MLNPPVQVKMYNGRERSDNMASRVEEFTISGEKVKAGFKDAGEQLTAELKRIFEEVRREGNIRRVVIKNKAGKVLVDLPALTAGAIGAVGLIVAPIVTILAAVGAIATELTVVIEKDVAE
jgi:hypothetical protein